MSAPEDDDLARFQTELLDLLSSGKSAVEIREWLIGIDQPEYLRDYVASFEPRMIGVAVELVQKWGRRDSATEVAAQSG